MINFRVQHKIYPPGVANAIVNSLKKVTANKVSFIDLSKSSAHVIFPERRFIGRNLKDSGIQIVRYRSPFLIFLPKVVAKIIPGQNDTNPNESKLMVKYRFGFLAFLLLLYFSIGPISSIIRLIFFQKDIDFFQLIFNLGIVIIIWGLAYFESMNLEKKIFEFEKIEEIGT